MRDGSLNGSPRRKRSLIKLKIVVFRPIPSARVTIAMKVKAGDLRSWRKANFKSFMSLGAQGLNRIDARGAPRRNQTRRGRNQCEHSRNCEINERIERVDFEKDVLQCSRSEDSEKQCRAAAAKNKTDDQLPRALGHDHSKNSARVRAQSHANAKFLRALIHGKTHHTVKSDRRENECDRAENAEQRRDDAVATKTFVV